MKFSFEKSVGINAPFQRGLSLIELMISITLGLIILVSLSTLFVNQSKTRVELDKSNRMIDNGRYAMELLASDIRLAGYWGEFVPPPPNSCSAFPVSIWGADVGVATGISPSPYSDIPVASLSTGSDLLTIRRVSTETPTAQTAAVNGVQYLQVSLCQYDKLSTIISTTPAAFTLRKKSCLPTSTTPYADLRKMLEHVYFISPNNVSGDNIPTLKRRETYNINATTGLPETIPLVEGIEYMQIEYGIDNNSSFLLTATTTAGSLDLTALSTDPVTARLKPGMGVYSDPKILAGYTIDTINANGTVTLKKEAGASPIVTGTLVPLTIPYLTATAVTGNASLSILNNASPKFALAREGYEICGRILDPGVNFGANALAANTTIAALNTTTITLTKNAILSGTVRLDIPATVISPKPIPGDGVADFYTAAPTTDQWMNVVSVKITLLARNTEPTKGYTDTKIYTLGRDAAGNVQTKGPIGDSYKRHVYTQFVRLVNAAGRRELP